MKRFFCVWLFLNSLLYAADVDNVSAILDLVGIVTPQGAQADLSRRKEIVYNRLAGHFKKAIKSSLPRIPSYYVDCSLSGGWLLKDLVATLEQDHNVVKIHIIGFPGSGKSTLISHFLSNVPGKKYGLIWRFDGSSITKLCASVNSFFRLIQLRDGYEFEEVGSETLAQGLSAICGVVRFKKRAILWLDDISPGVEKYINLIASGLCNKVILIIATRTPPKSYEGFENYQMQPMSGGQALNLFYRHYCAHVSESAYLRRFWNPSAIKSLKSLICFLPPYPLDICLAGVGIKHKGSRQYLQEYKEHSGHFRADSSSHCRAIDYPLARFVLIEKLLAPLLTMQEESDVEVNSVRNKMRATFLLVMSMFAYQGGGSSGVNLARIIDLCSHCYQVSDSERGGMDTEDVLQRFVATLQSLGLCAVREGKVECNAGLLVVIRSIAWPKFQELFDKWPSALDRLRTRYIELAALPEEAISSEQIKAFCDSWLFFIRNQGTQAQGEIVLKGEEEIIPLRFYLLPKSLIKSPQSIAGEYRFLRSLVLKPQAPEALAIESTEGDFKFDISHLLGPTAVAPSTVGLPLSRSLSSGRTLRASMLSLSKHRSVSVAALPSIFLLLLGQLHV